MSRMHIL